MGWEHSSFEDLQVYAVEIFLFANPSIQASFHKAFAYISWMACRAEETPCCLLKITFPDNNIYIFHLQLFFVTIAIFMEKQELWDLKARCWQLGPFYNSIMMIE